MGLGFWGRGKGCWWFRVEGFRAGSFGFRASVFEVSFGLGLYRSNQ